MLQLELPHVNVLSKIDLIETFGKLAFNLEFYTEVLDLGYLADLVESESGEFGVRHSKLTRALCQLVEDFGLVGFYTLCIQDKESLGKLLAIIDKAGGYVYGILNEVNQPIRQVANRSGIGAFEYPFLLEVLLS